MNATEKRICESFTRLGRATRRRKFEKAFRIYVEENSYVNIFNYLWYRYISHDFRNWLIYKYIN